ncbi:hypothetical protein AAFO92_21375 [Roseovarius sp. CAU 1744]|uniref:hypothetical protein n=1 Tax=Roseovarius sp. CAU 1744 TaxID=3140368 RepID=UPI00325A6EF4
MAGKKVHIHLGPHKTGSSAIQRALKDNAGMLAARFGLTHIATPHIAKAARLLNADRPFDAADALEGIAGLCDQAPGDCILSCEDLAGLLPGTRRVRQIYPKLWRNVAALDEALGAFDTRYYFFLRDPEDWIRSCYIQNLKYRQKFSSLEGFAEFIDSDGLWQGVTSETACNLGSRFVMVEYPQGEKRSAMQSLMSAIPGMKSADLGAIAERQANVSPSTAEIQLMERINRSSASQEAKRLAKLSLLAPEETTAEAVDVPADNDWFGVPKRPEGLPKTLEPLWQRVETRVRQQDQPNLMPALDVDLRPLRTQIVEADDELPDVGRGKMVNQAEILVYRFRNQPEICFLLGLTISYLRRDTPHTAHAAALFQRLWSEEYRLLLGLLPTRWLISSFQTFLDHGLNEDQKVIGASAYFYANMLKAYETERAFEDMPADATYPNKLPQTKMGFAGLDRFKLGGSDLILNTNALLLEYSARDAVAGRVVQEFMARARAANTIFSRMDKSRQAHGINIQQFSNCWSFFDEPK